MLWTLVVLIFFSLDDNNLIHTPTTLVVLLYSVIAGRILVFSAAISANVLSPREQVYSIESCIFID